MIFEYSVDGEYIDEMNVKETPTIEEMSTWFMGVYIPFSKVNEKMEWEDDEHLYSIIKTVD